MAESQSESAAELSGRTAVVTGASSGIGRAIALQLARAGADVLIHTRSRLDQAREVRHEVEACGVNGEILLADFAIDAHRCEFARRAWDWKGVVDIWVNNAGADVLTGEAAEWPFERKLEQLWRVDVLGTIELSRAIGRRMAQLHGAPGGRSILNMGWDRVETGMEGDSGEMFAAVKGAVIGFTRSLALTLAPRVRVNCLAPGWIRTRWGKEASPYWQQRACGESALERWGTPDDVARAARFLVSPDAQFLTGQTIAINGGIRSAVGGDASSE